MTRVLPTCAALTTMALSLALVALDAQAIDVQRLPPDFTTVETLPTAGHPNGIVQYDGDALFVAESGVDATASERGRAQIQIFRKIQGRFLAVGVVPIETSTGSANGLTLTPDRSTLLLSIDRGIAFVDVKDALAGHAQPTYLLQRDHGQLPNEPGTFATAVTPNGNYVFVANEYGELPSTQLQGNIGVVRLSKNADGKTQGTDLGYIPLVGRAVPGVTVSHDGRRVYATSEIVPAIDQSQLRGSGNPALVSNRCVQSSPDQPTPNGAVSVIDVAAATDPRNLSPDGTINHAVITNVAAACSPVRVVESAYGDSIWVSARGSDALLQFDVWRLLHPGNDASGGLRQVVSSGGSQPVAIKLFGKGLFGAYRYLMVANSDRFGSHGQTPDSTRENAVVFDLSGWKATPIQTIPTGFFPRDIATAHRAQQVFVSDYGSNDIRQLEQISASYP